MKTKVFIFIALTLGFILSGCGTVQPIPASEKTFTAIFDVKGVSKNDLFVRANRWFVANFANAESVIQYSDKESGTIAGKYYSELTVGPMFYGTKQMIEVDVKDERARIVISNPTDIYLGNVFGKKGKVPGFDWEEVNQENVMNAINAERRQLATSLEEALKKNDNW